ncbi:ribosomal protein S18-alanine N-acetyltransferase [Haliangium ochraceum]|uniref:Ribosomal-protein-alanine acetyltransferase n=1 Tax=Haliangium ochraceum (strain DSM 14365 / JCM 11303 / SMP-2) TaxID=502025 RepID=D0LG50_HALO1|nr:ribosomal protein S18-alanine N-acetyltransferase [Haliangium ochraceum]ACY18075.1 ribosomal-protein-alanine acetyltransferase [Haliangium ochraceum DSM 14365]
MAALHGLEIVPMELADLDQVVEIEQLSSPSPWAPKLFAEDLARDWARIDLARVRTGAALGPVLGFACYWLVHDELHLLNIAAHPDHRRRGIGRRLLAHMLAVAEARGTRYLTLEVRDSNHPAQALYRGYGFDEVGRRARYYSDGEDAIVMTLTRDFD